MDDHKKPNKDYFIEMAKTIISLQNAVSVHTKPGLVKMSAKLSLRNLANHFGIYVGAVNKILKRKREYGNLGEPLG